MTAVNFKPALLLNADFRPVSMVPMSLISGQDAIKDTLSERLSVVETYDIPIRTQGSRLGNAINMKLPSVVALKHYVSVDRPAPFTRYSVFIRDKKRCAYCQKELTMSEFTFDHVVPRSKGGKDCFENVVVSCSPCNTIKADKSLREAGMTLARKAIAPTVRQLSQIAMSIPIAANALHETWMPYLGPVTVYTNESDGRFPSDMSSADYWNVELETD
ncbi:HNH endonuclease [Thalassospira xiamenensis]|uniref:5-methylcytosine-specific restriction endonuclease McrA n=1 Tax=Thalassospira xiamenensis TaxID=220697 RepID=A0A285TWI4_9PROT|nr:HNH endonuclease [Thalassospira xiamenensis]SOC26707.1 5-methylcytosine-specific restriction endonuclease McrA [Thalassospira xiamenensis]